MTDPHDDTRLWPASPYDLADAHRCPACFTIVSAPECTGCGLALTDHRSGRVLELGRRILATEQERQSIIAAIRSTQADSAAVPVAHVGPPPWESSATATTSVPVPLSVPSDARTSDAGPDVAVVPVEVPPAAAPTAAPVEAPTPKRRLTVPVLLLIVGVSLVGVAAVFFVTLAWFVTGIAVRAVIVGGITVATIVLASILRRRTLPATAEGIAALGVVLLGLDAWAVRANDLFGAGDTRPAVWAGAAALVIAVLLRVWSRLSTLRVPDLAASVALPAGLGLLLGGLLDLPGAEAITAGLLGASAGGLLHALPAPWSAARPPRDAVAERVVLAVSGVTALVGAAAVGIFATDGVVSLIWVNVAVVVLGAAHALLLRPRPDELPAAPVLRGIASVVAALAAATIGWQLAWRSDEPAFATLVVPVAAVGVAAVLDRQRLRTPWLTPATIAAGVIGAVTLVAVTVLWCAEAGLRIADTWTLWTTDAAAAPSDPIPPVLAIVAGLLVTGLLFIAPTLTRPVPRGVRPVVAALLLLAAVSRTTMPLAIVGAGVLIAAVSVAVLPRAKARTGWILAGSVGAFGAFLAGLAAPWLWSVAVLVAAALPIAQRVATRATGARAVASVVAPFVVLSVSALIAPSAIGAVSGSGVVDESMAVVLLGWIALVAIAAAVLIRIDPASRSALVFTASALVAVSLTAVAIGSAPVSEVASSALLEPILAIPRGVVLLVFFAIVALHRTAIGAAPSLVAALLLAPLGVFTAHAIVQSVLGDLLDAGLPGWVPLIYTGVAAAFVWGAAAASWFHSSAVAARTRIAIDLGALATALVVMWPVASDLRGALIAIVGVGIAGASVSRGWAGPVGSTNDGFPTTRAEGSPLEGAPRRLLAWPAFGALTIALWVWLDTSWPQAQLEAYVIAPAVGLVVFGGLLLWLRRRIEATSAVALGLALGLVVPAVASWTGAGARGTVIAVVATAVCLALTLTPARRIVPIALAGASLSLAALVIAALGRASLGGPVQTLWLLLALAIAVVSSFGMVRVAASRPSAAVTAYATIAPSLVLIVTGGTSIFVVIVTRSLVVAVGVLVVVLGLHIAAAAWNRVPFATALRATAVAVAALAGAAFVYVGVVSEVEFVSVPVGVGLIAGALLAARRPSHHVPVERGAWIAGLLVATAPSLIAQPDALRVWLVIGVTLAAALALVFLPIADVARLKAPSSVVLVGVSVAMALRALSGPSDALPELAAIVAGAGAVAVAAGLVRTQGSVRSGAMPTIVAGAGALLVIATVALRLDGMLLTTALVALVAGAIGVGGALLLGSARWFGFATVVALGGATTASIAVGVRISTLSATTPEPDLWALIGLAIVAAIVIAALRASADRSIGLVAGGILSLALALFAAAEIALLQAPGAEWRALLAITVVSVGGVAGYILRPRLGLVLLVSAGVVAVVVAIAALVAGVRPIEAVTVVPALCGLAVGAWRMRTRAALRSWPALGAWLGLLTIPSLLHDFFGATDLWRVVALGVVAIALVLVGAMRRLQAPLVLGSAVLLVHAVAQLWPFIAAGSYVEIWWLWLGLGGALLIFVAATYEKRVRALKSAFAAVTSLR